MKVLIGYDGSDGAKSAIADLEWAGLPERIEAEVLTIADVFPHLTAECYRAAPAPVAGKQDDSPIIRRARVLAAEALVEAKELSEQGAAQVRARFPGWEVQASAMGHSPHWGLISRADSWGPDLIVVGSHGRSAVGRLLMGSVAQKAMAYSRCSVRIGRPRAAREARAVGPGPVKLLVGWDGSPAADEALATVAARRWPAGSQAILLTALDVPTSLGILSLIGGNGGSAGEERLIVARVDEAARRLHEAGLRVTTVIREGKPRSELLEESERAGVDCIFIGARGLSRIEWVLLGSVSATVAARAQCSVEVVRRAR